jgi:hypothetical protein
MVLEALNTSRVRREATPVAPCTWAVGGGGYGQSRTVRRAPQAQVGVVGGFLGAAAGPLGQPALGVGLHAPGDPLPEPILVAGPRGLAEDLDVSATQFPDGHPLQGGHLACDVQSVCHVISARHGVSGR